MRLLKELYDFGMVLLLGTVLGIALVTVTHDAKPGASDAGCTERVVACGFFERDAGYVERVQRCDGTTYWRDPK